MIIGLCGYIGAGKGTVADILVRHHGFVQLSYAGPLKEIAATAFGWSLDDLKGNTNRGWREQVDPFWAAALERPDFTPRKALEMIGTELFRKQFHEDFWTTNMHQRILSLTGRNIVIDDARFINEITQIKQLGGFIMVIDRQDNGREKSSHISNTGWVNCITNDDIVVTNTGTIDMLRTQVRTFLDTVTKREQ